MSDETDQDWNIGLIEKGYEDASAPPPIRYRCPQCKAQRFRSPQAVADHERAKHGAITLAELMDHLEYEEGQFDDREREH